MKNNLKQIETAYKSIEKIEMNLTDLRINLAFVKAHLEVVLGKKKKNNKEVYDLK